MCCGVAGLHADDQMQQRPANSSLPGAPGLASETWESGAVLVSRFLQNDTKRNNGLQICSAGRCRWTVGIGLEAFALSRVPEPLAANFRRGLIWGWGARASGLSHLAYETTTTFNLHSLDQPPFPCTVTLNRQARGVKRQALSPGWGGLGFEGGAIPMGTICGCFIGALEELKQHGIGIG